MEEEIVSARGLTWGLPGQGAVIILHLSFNLQVTVLFAGQHISKSPFEVNVDKAQGDASKVTAKGPGLEAAGNIANKPTYFDIYTAGIVGQAFFQSLR